MKTIIYTLLVATLALGCDDNDSVKKEATLDVIPEGPFPSLMKGLELYSWKKDGGWKFTLITGTNRNKTYQEITTHENKLTDTWVKISVSSIENLKVVLARVPAENDIHWISSEVFVSGFSIPPVNIVEEVEKHCESLDLHLDLIE
jgi:hypothetical protein